ncbi:killer cell lectin-like receptor 7 [Ochotona princeps]|uniref:killer cell lectin-like receptor 7 n=1 Tax=Ochotona princeps TaxID=9978 RepID=UPI0027148775|nr:killer cell lectin-like receptor 7 [Ochotona princeps]
MGDQEEMTYSSVRVLQSASESQKRLRPDGARRPGKSANKEFAVPWHRIAVSLGILSLLLLMTIIMLVTMIFQLIQEKHQQQEILANLSQSEYLKEQFLANKTLECDLLRNETLLQQKELESFFSKKGGCCTNPGMEGIRSERLYCFAFPF